MAPLIHQGNANLDGAPFNGWLVGSLEKWCAENGVAYDPGQMGLRDTGQVEIKWGLHPKGQLRPGGWSQPSDKVSISFLVRGDFLLRFRPPEDPAREVAHRLQTEGEYLIWREDVEHTWQAQQDSIILTVRWKAG
jgi:hypothetical protein